MDTTTLTAPRADADTHAGRAGGRLAVGDFFRHHGLWSPGVRLLRNVSFHGNSLIISLVFALPIALLMWVNFSYEADAIAFSGKERIGLHYVRDALKVAQTAQQMRGFAAIEAAGGKPMPQSAAAAQALDQALAELAASERERGAQLNTAAAYGKLLDANKKLAPAAEGPDRVLATHNARIAAALDLVDAATDGANLSLDPDLDTFSLMSGAVLSMPGLIENAAQLRDRGAVAVTVKSIGPVQMRRVIEAKTRADFLFERLAQSVAKVRAARPEVAAQLAMDPAKKALDELYDTVGETLYTTDGKVAGDAAAYFEVGTRAIDALRASNTRMLEQLDTLLAERVSRLARVRNQLAGATLACLLLAGYLFVCFRKVIKGGIDNLARHMEAMSRGNLTTEPRSWGGDEVASLIDTTDTMRVALRDMLGRIRATANGMAGASNEVATGTQDLAQRTDDAAGKLERATASMDSMQEGLRGTAASTQEAAQLATQNAQMAEHGGAVIARVMSTMDEIRVASARIADIIGAIDGIAFQTNILALNAAVEAARAGEQGRGFAVVAGEVRMLAQRSAQAAREIKALIDDSVARTQSGAQVVTQAGDAIRDIVGAAQRVNQLLAGIAATTREQSDGVVQVGAELRALDGLTQQNAALVEETTAAIESIRQQAADLATEAGRFQL